MSEDGDVHKYVYVVVSGGQTGADISALRAAKKMMMRTDGWVPYGFLSSRSSPPDLSSYALKEVPNRGSFSDMLVERSKRNVDDARVTIAFRLFRSPGTDSTISYALSKKWGIMRLSGGEPKTNYRPVLVISSLDDHEAEAARITAFVRKHEARIVNVCGHRACPAVPKFEAAVERVVTLGLWPFSPARSVLRAEEK